MKLTNEQEIKETERQIKQIKDLIKFYRACKSYIQYELIKDLCYYKQKLLKLKNK